MPHFKDMTEARLVGKAGILRVRPPISAFYRIDGCPRRPIRQNPGSSGGGDVSPRLVTARHLSVLVLCLARAAFAETGSAVPGSSTLAPSLVSGLDTQSIDTTVRPQDDFYRFVNGKWLDATEIPADKASFGSFDIRYEESLDQLRGIVEAAAQDAGAPEGSDGRRIGNLYRSFQDEARLE